MTENRMLMELEVIHLVHTQYNTVYNIASSGKSKGEAI